MASASSSNPIIFYDIASGPPVRPFAPNPWKTRYALNFKRAHYVTEWVDLADVTSTRKSLGADPVRFFGDGEPFYTLPVIQDTTPGADGDGDGDKKVVVGDSFDIAVHLEKKHPDGPALFRHGAASVGLYASFNARMDTLFTTGAALASEGMPWNPATEAQCKAEFCRRAGVQTFDELVVRGEARRKIVAALQAALGEAAKCFRFSEGGGGGGGGGPFLAGGQEPDYADFIIGGWLMFLSGSVPEWEEEIRTWHGGLWGKLQDALEPYRGTW